MKGLNFRPSLIRFTEAAIRTVQRKKVFLKILQYSQENVFVGVSF